MIVYNSRRQRASLKAQPLARGGEGQVYEIEGQSGLLAKVYTAHRSDYERKLLWMMHNPPAQPRQPAGHASIAWPSDLLYDQRGAFIGYVMPRIRTAAPLLSVFNPRRRAQTLPGFDWRYLHRTARNMSSALSAIHARNYVVGDLNESNVLVTPAALVTFIDTDSFQVQATYNGQAVPYYCPVGKPEYTAPELQGRTFQTTWRTPAADRFALGVLVFQLLMDGSHPFRSRWYGQGDPPSVAEKISRGWFPYSTLGADPVQPPTTIPSLKILHPSVETLLYRCFVDGYRDAAQRPKPEEWEQALIQAEGALVRCPNRPPDHYYSSHLPRCPICDPSVTRPTVTITMPMNGSHASQPSMPAAPPTNASRPAPAAPPQNTPVSPPRATPTPTPRPVASNPQPAPPRPGPATPSNTARPRPSAASTPPPSGSPWSSRSTPPPSGSQRATGPYPGGARTYGSPPGSGSRPYSSPPPSWGSAPRSQSQTATAPRPNPLATLLFGSLLQPFTRSSVPQRRSFIRHWVSAIVASVSAFLWDWAVDIAPVPYRMRDMAHRYRRQSFATVMAVTMVITLWISMGGPGALWTWTWSSAAAAAPGVIAYAQTVPGRVRDLAIEAQNLIQQQHTLTVAPRGGWQPTDIVVEKGDKVSFRIDGAGAMQGQTLSARIGGQTFPVPPDSYVIAEETGSLALRVNNAGSAPGDTGRPVQVTVTVSH